MQNPAFIPSFWSGKTVWVIGASKGIGRAIVESLAEKGATVLASARPSADLDALAEWGKASDNLVYPLPWDATAPSDKTPADLATMCPDGINVLIYSAGFWEPTHLPVLDVESIGWQMEVNYVGMVRAIAVVLPGMVARGEGIIAGIGSAAALAPLPKAEGYGASKSAVSYFLQTLRLELRKFGIRVVTILPGFVDTDLTRKNEFNMPFMISPSMAASSIISGLESGLLEIHGPKRLTIPLKLIGWLPRRLKEAFIGRFFVR